MNDSFMPSGHLYSSTGTRSDMTLYAVIDQINNHIVLMVNSINVFC